MTQNTKLGQFRLEPRMQCQIKSAINKKQFSSAVTCLFSYPLNMSLPSVPTQYRAALSETASISFVDEFH